MLKKIISGGQTGADIAALDVAIKHDIDHGGAIPKGRLTEDGPLPVKYKLQEMSSSSYPARTEKNVCDADGTVIFSHGSLKGGSLLTRQKALLHNKPVLHLDMEKHGIDVSVQLLFSFIVDNRLEVLNVAGTRGSEDIKIYNKTFLVMEKVVQQF